MGWAGLGLRGSGGAGACDRGVKGRDEQLRGCLTGISGCWWAGGDNFCMRISARRHYGAVFGDVCRERLCCIVVGDPEVFG